MNTRPHALHAPRRPAQAGFTLLELTIVVAVVGILSAIALPAYANYVKKSKVVELLNAASQPKTAVMEYLNVTNSLPTPEALNLPPVSTSYVQSRDYTRLSDTQVRITVAVRSESLGEEFTDKTLSLTGTTVPGAANAETNVDWHCSATIPDKYLAAACRSGS